MKTIAFFVASLVVRMALAISQRIQPKVINDGQEARD
jgi:hypothetical protein